MLLHVKELMICQQAFSCPLEKADNILLRLRQSYVPWRCFQSPSYAMSTRKDKRTMQQTNVIFYGAKNGIFQD